jgi:hypothetical protein
MLVGFTVHGWSSMVVERGREVERRTQLFIGFKETVEP